MLRSSVSAVLELAALDKHDWELALQRILRIDSHVLGVDRASYWSLASEPRSLTCELGYVDSADALERGAVLTDGDARSYLDELTRSKVIEVEDVDKDPRTVELRAYCYTRRIRSMLDIPVWVQARLVGVVCHEHVGEVRRWTAAEVDFALSVAQVIATALEARARTHAEERERHASFLARTSMVLSGSLEEQVVAERAVAGALPQLADWAALDRFEHGSVDRIAVDHADPDKRAILARYAARFPPGPRTPHMSVQARGLNQAALVADVTDEELRHNGFDEEHIGLLRQVGVHSAIAVPFRTEGGIDLAMMFVSTGRTYDYDDLKLAEEYVERVAAALHNARVYRLAQEALRARDDFLAMAAHELRTPLTSLRTSCERLSTLPVVLADADLNAVVERIMRQSRRLTRLVNRMLDASTEEQRLPFIVPEQVDLVPLVRETVEELAATRRDARLELSLPPSLIGQWDGDRLRQVVGNLVENALKYGGDAPIRIALAADPARAQAVLTVSDRGIGIDAAVVPRLFEPYQRGVSGRGYGGLGLGLFIARQIVNAHGGSIDVHSEPGAGSEFTVRLPLS
jgi:signal transduction histidine kinase